MFNSLVYDFSDGAYSLINSSTNYSTFPILANFLIVPNLSTTT